MISRLTLSTNDSSGFLKRLCHHFSLKIPAEYDATQGHAEFPMGRCDMRVAGEELHLEVTAENKEKLDTVKDIVGQHVVLFGKRENLQANWTDE